MDKCDKGSDSEEMMLTVKTPETVSSDESSSHVKICTDCGTTRTPLWRGGPAGPKSLCNACGIRSRKKRRALLGLNKHSIEQKSSSAAKAKSKNRVGKRCGGESSGKDIAMERQTAAEKLRMKLGEVEQAAILLMALSCGSVFA